MPVVGLDFIVSLLSSAEVIEVKRIERHVGRPIDEQIGDLEVVGMFTSDRGTVIVECVNDFR